MGDLQHLSSSLPWSYEIKTVWYWLKHKYIYQWKRTGSPETSPYTYDQLIFDSSPRLNWWRKYRFFSANGNNWISTWNKKKHWTLAAHTKINSKWIFVKAKIINLLEENIEENLMILADKNFYICTVHNP